MRSSCLFLFLSTRNKEVVTMKKFLALVLTVVMAASLAACGNSGTKETQAPASGDSETAAESTAAESTGETAEKGWRRCRC
mgnify:FL=1